MLHPYKRGTGTACRAPTGGGGLGWGRRDDRGGLRLGLAMTDAAEAERVRLAGLGRSGVGACGGGEFAGRVWRWFRCCRGGCPDRFCGGPWRIVLAA